MKNLADVNIQAGGHRIDVMERHDGVTILLDGNVLYDSDEKAKNRSVEQQLADAAEHIDTKPEGLGAVHAVLFALEAIEDPSHPKDRHRDRYKPHVRVVSGGDTETTAGLFHRHYVLSSALSAVHSEMAAAVERLEDLAVADATPDGGGRPEDLN